MIASLSTKLRRRLQINLHIRHFPARLLRASMEILNPCSWLCQILLLLAAAMASAAEAGGATQMYDITHLTHNGMPIFDSATGAGQVINETVGEFVSGTYKLGTHVGTHVDSPDHMRSLIKLGIDAPDLKLKTLIGPVLVVRVPDGVNITDKVLKSLDLPKEVKRVIFKTKNTDRRLMYQQAFVPDYTAFTPEGAKWLVANTKIKFVGIDYMSIAVRDYLVTVHEILLNKTGIIPVECLKLDGIEPGQYNVYCLPMKLMAEAAPTRCILLK